MHDLNDALDELRAVIPYAHGPSVRKLSKIATLLLAKNYILMQARALDELRRLVGYMNHTAAAVGVTGLQPRPPLASSTVRTPSKTAGTDAYPTSELVTPTNTCYSASDAAVSGGDASEDTETQRNASSYSPSS